MSRRTSSSTSFSLNIFTALRGSQHTSAQENLTVLTRPSPLRRRHGITLTGINGILLTFSKNYEGASDRTLWLFSGWNWRSHYIPPQNIEVKTDAVSVDARTSAALTAFYVIAVHEIELGSGYIPSSRGLSFSGIIAFQPMCGTAGRRDLRT